jgi:hypothetical protein
VLTDNSIRYADEPALTAEGVETIARCAWPPCGAPYVPTSAAHIYCADRCRYAAKTSTETWKVAQSRRSARSYGANASYRNARRALRERGVDPDTVPALEALRGQGVVAEWRALVGLPVRETAPCAPGRRSLAADPARPWRATVGPQPEHLGARGLALRFTPDLPYAESTRRHLHGLLSGLVASAHDANLPAWALVPLAPRGWGVVLFDAAVAERLRGTEHAVTVGDHRARLTLGPALVRLRTPPALSPGRYVVRLDAVTAVVQTTMGRTRPVTQPAVTTVLGALSLALQVAGVSPAGRIHVEAVDCETQPERVRLGGHVGAGGVVVGWVGRLTIRCNAPATWALQVAASVGYGGKCAFGLGRVRVAVERA